MILKEKLVIVGSGPAGLTAAVYAARAALSPLVIDGSAPGGQLMSTSMVENWPGEMQIFGSDLMKKMRDQALHNKARFLSETLTQANLIKRPFELTTERGTHIHAESLIIATGAEPKRLHCPGESEYWGKGVTSCAVCDGAFYKNLPVVVVGGGDSAMENASFLTNYTQDITIVHILPQLTASHAMQSRIMENPSIKIVYESTVTSIEGNGKVVSGITITHQKTGTVSSLDTRGVFISIGLNPNTALFKNQLEMNSYGYLLLKENTQTSIPGVFAAGDVADSRYRQAITAAGTGCAATLDAERFLKDTGLK